MPKIQEHWECLENCSTKKIQFQKDLQVLENTMIAGHVIITSRQRTEEEFFFKNCSPVQCNATRGWKPKLRFKLWLGSWMLKCQSSKQFLKMASMLMSIVVRVYPHEKPTIRFITKLKSKEIFFLFLFFFFFDLVKNPDQSNTKTIRFICKLVKSKGLFLFLFFFFLMKSSLSQHEIHQIFIPKKKIKGTKLLLNE